MDIGGTSVGPGLVDVLGVQWWLWTLVGALNAWLARRRGRSAFTWFWLSQPLGLLGSAFLVVGDRARPAQRGFDVPGTTSDGRLLPERVALVVAALVTLVTAATLSWPGQVTALVVLFGAWALLVWRRKATERRAGAVPEV